MTKRIRLQNGKYLIIDKEHYSWVSNFTWCVNGRGYVMSWHPKDHPRKTSKARYVFLHRLVLCARAGFDVDHINGNKLDNRSGNLRIATRSQNNANSRISTGKSKYKGVYRRWDGKRWVAQIRAEPYKIMYLGSFESEDDAAMAYNKAAKKYFRKFACLNKI